MDSKSRNVYVKKSDIKYPLSYILEIELEILLKMYNEINDIEDKRHIQKMMNGITNDSQLN